MALAPADETVLRHNLDERSLGRSSETAGRGVVEAIPKAAASSGLADRRHFEIPLGRLVPARCADDNGFNAADLERRVAGREEPVAKASDSRQSEKPGQELTARGQRLRVVGFHGMSRTHRKPRFGVRWFGRTQFRKNTVMRAGPSDHAPPRMILYIPSDGPGGFSAGLVE